MQHLMQRFSIEWVAPILTGGNITCDVIDCTGYSPTIKRLQFDYMIWKDCVRVSASAMLLFVDEMRNA